MDRVQRFFKVKSLGIELYCIWVVKERILGLQDFLIRVVIHRDGELEEGPIKGENWEGSCRHFEFETFNWRCLVGMWPFRSQVQGSDLEWSDTFVAHWCIGGNCIRKYG